MVKRIGTKNRENPSDYARSFNRIGEILRRFVMKENIRQENFNFFFLISGSVVSCLLGHALFIPLFAWLGVKPMALFNIGSVVLYSICFIVNRKGYHYLAQTLLSFELLAHAALATYYLGWQSGFHIYAISAIIIAGFSPVQSILLKALIICSFIGFYLGLNVWSEANAPLFSIHPTVLRWIFLGNTVSFLALISLSSHYYRFSVARVERRLREACLQLELLAKTDPLTNLLNRRSIMEIIRHEIQRHKTRPNQVFSIILADIDNFKAVNDQYGHECGDKILETLAERLKNALREQDQVARWGGEEFLIFLPMTDMENGRKVAERLKAAVGNNAFAYKKWIIHVTMTFGLTVYDGTMNILDCINEADAALRQGKQMGKNCVIIK